MKNQREIVEEIGRVQFEIEAIPTKVCGCRSINCEHRQEIENNVSKHKCLNAYKNALVWVIDMKIGQTS